MCGAILWRVFLAPLGRYRRAKKSDALRMLSRESLFFPPVLLCSLSEVATVRPEKAAFCSPQPDVALTLLFQRRVSLHNPKPLFLSEVFRFTI